MNGMYDIVRYKREMKQEWDAFVSQSKNATFLFMRDYMDYHSDRFTDCSWMVYKKGKLVALLPANITDDGTLHSHQGLTYGGWILPKSHIDGEDLLEIFAEAINVWKKLGISVLDYKPLPYIYSERPSQEDIYALFRLGAEISETNISMAIDYSSPGEYNKLRCRNLKSTIEFVGKVEEFEDITEWYEVLVECLDDRYGAKPVHTLEELKELKSKFPTQIRFFGLRSGATASCGRKDDSLSQNLGAVVCIFDTGIVAHTQYIATTEEGRENNLLTPLFTHLINDVFSERRYFDFGTSNEDGGRYLNTGLLRQKASFGASAVAYSRYRLQL